MNLQVQYNHSKQLSCKKGCSPMKNDQGENKVLIYSNNSGEFCAGTGIRQPELLLLKFLPIRPDLTAFYTGYF